MRRLLSIVSFFGFIGCIFGANYLITRYGIVPVGFGLTGPAGVFLVGPAFVFRDMLQWSSATTPNLIRDKQSSIITLLALAVGITISYQLASKQIAFASAVAFGLSEFVDFVAFTIIAPKRNTSTYLKWARAVLVSGIFGIVIDSIVFLSIAFHSLRYAPGQMLGKLYGVLIASVIIAVRRKKTANV